MNQSNRSRKQKAAFAVRQKAIRTAERIVFESRVRAAFFADPAAMEKLKAAKADLKKKGGN